MPDIDELLDKNPDVREIFESNREKLSRLPDVKKLPYRLAVPYGSRRPVEPMVDVGGGERRPKASYVTR